MKSRRYKPSRQQADAADQALHKAMLWRLRQGADLRKRKVRHIRAALREQRYFNLLKLHVAADRLADELSSGG